VTRTQKTLLAAEGVEVGSDYTIDMEKYRYHFDQAMFWS
jgi:hypothetical protein